MTDSQRNDAFRKYFYRQLDRIAEDGSMSPVARGHALRRLVLEIFEQATANERLHFSTNFARISYSAHKFGIPHQHIFQERHFRRRKIDGLNEEELERQLFTGYKLATELIRYVFGGAVPDNRVELLTLPYPFPYRAPEVRERFPSLRVIAVEEDEEEALLYVREEVRAEQVYAIPFARETVPNPLVAQAIAIIRKVSGMPVLLNLISAELRDDGFLYPDQIVVEPDYLIDVTAVAESFDGVKSYQPWSSLTKKLLPYRQTIPLLRGNLVNYFLDRLVEDPETDFKELLRNIFQTQPLALCLFDDREIKQLIEQLKHHYVTLQKFVRQDMAAINLDRASILLEPTFLSPEYGVQGRLDLLQAAPGPNDPTTIVELKTSKYWKPNKFGINQTNYIQTLLYDLMINQALGADANVRSYILYSNDYEAGLKYAPPERNQMLEAVAARNQLIGVEFLLTQLGTDPNGNLREEIGQLMSRLNPDHIPGLGSFSKRDHQKTLEVFSQLTPVEQCYFGAFLGFVAREQKLAKTGEQRLEGINGLASLWLDEREQKTERFEILDGLTFSSYDQDTATLNLKRPADDDRLVKFRQGDIIALYGTSGREASPRDPIRSQILKSTLISLRPDAVQLRLRSHQLSDAVFHRSRYWSIEKDVLDSSFRNHYQGMMVWADSPPPRRRQWLGLDPPGEAAPLAHQIDPGLTDQQNRILQRIITAPDYFLLWGPPGTGKTSQMLHHLVRYLLEHTEEHLLLVAYTNRAVDEICESIERITGPDGSPYTDYLRIGSRYGVAPQFEERLLQIQSSRVNTRSALTDLIRQRRVVVGTVASVGGKEALFTLKQFDRIIVDEASQILEPLLAGLLPRAPRSLLIGDHRQLPAVVQQREEDSRVYDQGLRKLGLQHLSTSLFERLYRTAQEREWHWAYDQLSHQGRMHADIMDFPATHFYDHQLDILPESIAHRKTQLLPLPPAPASAPPLVQKISDQRLLFLETEPDLLTGDPKVNDHEAALMVDLIGAFEALYAGSDRPIRPGDIGIITPYRAQIAHIRQRLVKAGQSPDDFTVDTVERYQGGAKRIILISLCTNEDKQIQMLSQISEEGVDRKLNVAMTRAREHLVLVGCPHILRQSTVYGALLDYLSGDQARTSPYSG
ncbi:AAA domain-containing protein [Lewinella sp. W8]|uniref:AAA domain-containing protein n=1 Tax=Lewinella sp. W8 TaxID=2528208 RepID=UPI00156608A4|nr:AAA domain-containing protein [Lewinella sp. W8]